MMPDRKTCLEMLRRMYRIRSFEEQVKIHYDYTSYLRDNPESEGVISGAAHLAIGQEGTEVGVCAALEPGDFVASTHRGHGHAIAKGADLKPMMAELMGRKHGYSGGCGGSMHIFSPELGLIGGNGIVGAQVPIATGAAFSAKYRGTRQVAVAFFSEGAANQGAFHEALNMAALWDLPAVYVCENNLYAATTPASITLSPPDVAAKAAAYDLPGVIVDGQDTLAVYRVASEAVDSARAGNGPTLIECKTYRFVSHAGGGQGEHNNPEELETWKSKDPIALFERKLFDAGYLTAEEKQNVISETGAAAREAVAYGKQSPYPDFEDMPVTSGVAL
ncbi:MAG: thiamine pyrophosphate-dependent dehydrogenase E1 component subunit alpha [Gemmatimonadota bacterium]|nr:thiamine pyrophosphate-dependent dehydrogenase E1 component subunit alpha [Gemmatimonadota bacterium]